MANLIKLDDKEYPVSTTEFLNRYSDLAFPVQVPYGDYGYAVVFPAPTPSYDPIAQYIREIAPVLTEKGHWEQQYEIKELEPEQIAANQAAAKEQAKTVAVAQIQALQSKALRALIEDAPGKQWLNKYRADITALRAKL